MLPTKDIENFVQREMKFAHSAIHNFGHLKRVADGAVWFVKVLGGTKEEEKLAYIAGLLHDIVRPATEKVCHAAASAEKSRKVLQNFNVDSISAERILLAIKDHRLPPEKWTSPLHQSVYLADKIFEQMGGQVAFRRCMWVGESVDYKGMPWKEAAQKAFVQRFERIPPTAFPKRFSKLIEYQFAWPVRFSEALSNNEPWALWIGDWSYKHGRSGRIGIEEMIERFRPKYSEDKEFKKEALEYIKGKKFRQFAQLAAC